MESRARAAESQIATSSGQDALGHAIRAAELYMKAAGEPAKSKADASRLRRHCNQLIAYAERLKAEIPAIQSDGASIIHRASRLHGNFFPPWDTEPSNTEFQRQSDGHLFIDSTSFNFSVAQAESFAAWRRPQQLFTLTSGSLDEDTAMDAGSSCSFIQDITTDCSLVASLCAATTVLTGKHSVLSSIIHPFNHLKGRPQLSSSGKYIMRLYFNGCSRRVVIDDRLPASRTSRSLFVLDQHNPNLLWPALLEKAYLKVRGGYDFPGSNSGTDLWVLIGWIPEQIFLQREDLDIDETWDRIKKSHDVENVIITLGTGQVSEEEESIMGLIGEHGYAVQKLDDSDGVRRLLIKNPWCNGPDLKVAGWSSSPEFYRNTHTGATGDMSTGLLWVALEDVAQNFESMYLNWNPSIFNHRQDHHFSWEIPPTHYSTTLVGNPQFSIYARKGGLVWVLISRHFVDEELDIARERGGPMATASQQLGFISILILDRNGHRVQVGDGDIYRGPFIDSPQTVARFEMVSSARHTVALDQHGFPLKNYTFTMSVFSQEPVDIKEAIDPFLHSTEQLSSWTRRTAGGNSSNTTYFLNPQFSLSLAEPGPISILLCTENSGIHIHIDLVWAGGRRANSARVRDLLATSGEYRRGYALVDIPTIAPGVYTLVCSTFEPGQHAGFALRVLSLNKVDLESIPVDTAGRLRNSLKTFDPPEVKGQIRSALFVSRLTRASISARSVVSPTMEHDEHPSSSLLIRVSVVYGWGPEQLSVAVSANGEFEDPTIALRTSEFDIEPSQVELHGMWLVIEWIGAHWLTKAIECDIFSDSPVQANSWEEVF